MVVVDRPFRIVEVQLGTGRTQVHVGFEVGFQGSDIAPVGFFLNGLSGNLVGIEIVGKEPSGRDQRRNDVLAEIMRTVRLDMVLMQKMQNVSGAENVIAHRGERHVFVVRQRRRVFRFSWKPTMRQSSST